MDLILGLALFIGALAIGLVIVSWIGADSKKGRGPKLEDTVRKAGAFLNGELLDDEIGYDVANNHLAVGTADGKVVTFVPEDN